MCSTTASGVACCGSCRGELKIVCENGCELPDPIFASNPIAVMPRPHGPRTKHSRPINSLYPTGRKAVPGICTYRDCPDPIAAQKPEGAPGRPHTKCDRHLAQSRKWSATHLANVAAR